MTGECITLRTLQPIVAQSIAGSAVFNSIKAWQNQRTQGRQAASYLVFGDDPHLVGGGRPEVHYRHDLHLAGDDDPLHLLRVPLVCHTRPAMGQARRRN